MILQVSISSWQSGWKELSPEDYAGLREVIPGLPAEKTDYIHDLMIDDDGLRAMARLGLEVRLCDGPGADNVNTMLVKLQERINSLEMRGERDIAKLAAAGGVVQIAIPDLALMYIDEVFVADNCCTDTLSGYLEEGWRILAVCPPNAQRRPDYVLGRRKAAAA